MRRTIDRFTPEMLESYCAALGIELFNADFYGEQCLLEHTAKRAASAQGLMMSNRRRQITLAYPGKMKLQVSLSPVGERAA
jgi:hypothetical protein